MLFCMNLREFQVTFHLLPFFHYWCKLELDAGLSQKETYLANPKLFHWVTFELWVLPNHCGPNINHCWDKHPWRDKNHNGEGTIVASQGPSCRAITWRKEVLHNMQPPMCHAPPFVEDKEVDIGPPHHRSYAQNRARVHANYSFVAYSLCPISPTHWST